MVTSSSRLIDSINMAFIIHTTYHIGVTNFGDYLSIIFVPWYATAKISLWFKFSWGLTCRSLPVRLPWRRHRPETYKEKYPFQGNSFIWRCISLCDKILSTMLML